MLVISVFSPENYDRFTFFFVSVQRIQEGFVGDSVVKNLSAKQET